nr:ATP synthase F0 subunit 8 [Decimiana sp. JZ-2017]
MPQMMPLNWFILFMLISSLLIMFNIKNYFSLYKNIYYYSHHKMMKKSLNWKW